MSQSKGEDFGEMGYEFPELWDEDWFSRDDHDRVRRVSELIPNDTRTMADVGFGNVLFLNFMTSNFGPSSERRP